MQDFGNSFTIAFQLVSSFDPDLAEIVRLSLKVSLSAVLFSALIGLPLGAALATSRFRGRNVLIIIVNALMGLPPVVVGLLVYLAFSNAGPFGWMQLLYSPSAMIIAQTILVTPIITALTREIIEQLNGEYEEYFKSLCLTRWQRLTALLWDARYGLLTVGLAGFGRAIAEVGAVIIVGGNIDHLTRVMTTAIALETSRGDLSMALALGIVLLTIALTVNAAVMMIRNSAARTAYA
ncbi:MAG: ABC transporter permease subunit [Gammaproteobacteria bacterium]|nr:ABC transporter permease subunit [Gammaproteobacteria bacterium]